MKLTQLTYHRQHRHPLIVRLFASALLGSSLQYFVAVENWRWILHLMPLQKVLRRHGLSWLCLSAFECASILWYLLKS